MPAHASKHVKLARAAQRAGDCTAALKHLKGVSSKQATQIRRKCVRKTAFKDYKYPSVASLLKAMK